MIVSAKCEVRSAKCEPGSAVASDFALHTSDFLLWQLVDSAFPTGGFAHSAGLEAAWQHGEVRDRDALASFIDASLLQLGHAALPFVTASFDAPEKLCELDELCDVFTTNHVANRASRAQGRALFIAAERVFNVGQASRLSGAGETPALHYFHFAPMFGFVTACLGLERETILRMFFFSHLRSILAAAVRLNIVGPMEAQSLQYQLSSRAEEVLHRCRGLAVDEIAQTSPLIDLWQGAQDRLYSRLFQS